MKVIYQILKFLFAIAMLTALPIWIASSLDLHVGVFVITFDFILCMILAGASDHRRNVKQSKARIRFPFPFYSDEF